MTDDIEARAAEALEKIYGCKPGAVHEGYGAECDSTAHAPALYWTFGCDHAAHVASVLAEAHLLADWHDTYLRLTDEANAARAELAKVKAERDEANAYAAFQTKTLRTAEALVKRHAAAHADIVARIEALADGECTLDYCEPDPDSVCFGGRIRAALRGDGEATT